MGAVAGPLVAAGFVTPVNRATGTTPASTALTSPHGENGPAPLLSQWGGSAVARPPLANSAVNSFVSVHVGSHGNFSALELRSFFCFTFSAAGSAKFRFFVVFSSCLSFKTSFSAYSH